jgi:hypothetical protein
MGFALHDGELRVERGGLGKRWWIGAGNRVYT